MVDLTVIIIYPISIYLIRPSTSQLAIYVASREIFILVISFPQTVFNLLPWFTQMISSSDHLSDISKQWYPLVTSNADDLTSRFRRFIKIEKGCNLPTILRFIISMCASIIGHAIPRGRWAFWTFSNIQICEIVAVELNGVKSQNEYWYPVRWIFYRYQNLGVSVRYFCYSTSKEMVTPRVLSSIMDGEGWAYQIRRRIFSHRLALPT